jgi:predicted permease
MELGLTHKNPQMVSASITVFLSVLGSRTAQIRNGQEPVLLEYLVSCGLVKVILDLIQKYVTFHDHFRKIRLTPDAVQVYQRKHSNSSMPVCYRLWTLCQELPKNYEVDRAPGQEDGDSGTQ